LGLPILFFGVYTPGVVLFRRAAISIIFLVVALLLIPLPELQSQEKSEQEGREVYFLPALGINIFSNVALNLADRYIAREHYAQISFESIKNNFLSPWEWDGSAHITNQLGHPYQGSIYHGAARANGFTFYESLLFDAFGSASWELIFETNTPAINDLISTTIGGASLGEMLHRLYLETPSPFAVLISPADAFNGLITKRRPQRRTTRIHSLDLAFGTGYTYSRQAEGRVRDRDLIPLLETHSFSADISLAVVYSNPFLQQSWIPYDHFELSLYANIAYPFWYHINILSDGYVFSFNVLDNEKSAASTGLSLHYDLFADRHSNFFGSSLDWTFKYRRVVSAVRDFEFKGHVGAVIFDADDSYVFGRYTNVLQTANNYGAGINMKLFVATAHKKWGKLRFNASIYEVFSIFANRHSDRPEILFIYTDLSYELPIGDGLHIGASGSVFRNAAISDLLKDTDKLSAIGKFYIRREM
jgi:hypothetical protein